MKKQQIATFSLRIPKTLQQRVAKLARAEKRSINNTIAILLEQCLTQRPDTQAEKHAAA